MILFEGKDLKKVRYGRANACGYSFVLADDLKLLTIISSKYLWDWTTTQIFHSRAGVVLTTCGQFFPGFRLSIPPCVACLGAERSVWYRAEPEHTAARAGRIDQLRRKASAGGGGAAIADPPDMLTTYRAIDRTTPYGRQRHTARDKFGLG